MANSNIIFSHGDKGGVGKSTALIWLIENAISRGLDFGIIETDPKIPDVGDRYNNTHTVIYAPLEASGESDAMQGISRLFDAAVALEKTLIFVNLPAAASMRLDPEAALISEALKDSGFSLRVAFVSDDRSHSKALLEKSLSEGVMCFADENVVLLNGNFGGGDLAGWPVTKANTFGKDVTVSVMPKVSDVAWKVVNKYAAPINHLLPEVSSLNAKILERWIDKATDPLNIINAVHPEMPS